MKATPERIAKAPEWVREHISHLEGQLRYLTERNEELEARMRTLAGEQEKTRTNVRLQLEDAVMSLPQDSVVEFGEDFEVFPSVNDPDAIEIMTGHGSLCIIPAGSYHIYVRRAD
jgi:hypothetical protein